MTPRKPTHAPKLLTEAELELMNILWRIEQGSVNDVLEKHPARENPAYTTVSTILRILEQKKIVGSRKEGRGHIYFPLLKKEDYEATTLKHVVENVFDQTPSSLVKRLLESEEISDDELQSIRELLNQKAKGRA